MDALLRDIRLLKLAELYEIAYESFVLDLAERYVRDESVRAEVRKLAEGADGHGARVSELLRERSGRLAAPLEGDLERAALLDILEVERAARDFYRDHLEEVSDPEVARLFRALSREEAEHVSVVEGAIALSDRRRGRLHAEGFAARARRSET